MQFIYLHFLCKKIFLFKIYMKIYLKSDDIQNPFLLKIQLLLELYYLVLV